MTDNRDFIDGLPRVESYELRRLISLGKSCAFRPTMMRRLLEKGLVRVVAFPDFEPTEKGRAVAAAGQYREVANV